MQEPGRRPFAGVDLRRPKGYPAPSAAAEVRGEPCPRCESRDTKFCYYNNYNTSQPRHYCRSCRRYWTKGGSLRNVPVGGGSRKGSSSSSSTIPNRANNSKRRRVAPSDPESGTAGAAAAAEKEDVAGYPATEVDAERAAANGTVGDHATAVDAAGTEATGNGSVGDHAAAVDAARREAADGPGAAPAVDDVGFADPSSVALGLGVVGAGGKEPPDASPFEWPSGCDLGSYWAPGVLADADPALFLNLP